MDNFIQQEQSFTFHTHIPRQAQKKYKYLSCYHKLIIFATFASNNWWDHSLDCHKVKTLAINTLKLLDQKRQPTSWHQAWWQVSFLHLHLFCLVVAVLGGSWDLYTKKEKYTCRKVRISEHSNSGLSTECNCSKKRNRSYFLWGMGICLFVLLAQEVNLFQHLSQLMSPQKT